MELSNARDAADLLGRFVAHAPEEVLAFAFLDEGRRLQGTAVHPGRADAVDLPLRQILGEGIRLGSAALVIAHNHPSGDPRPSAADLAATRRLAEMAAALGMKLDDHLVFGGGRCCSLRALGLL